MKNVIQYYYGIFLEELTKINNIYYFKKNNSFFYFVPYKNNSIKIEELNSIINELFQKNVPCHSIVVNRNHKFLTNVEKENYILLKINSSIQEEISVIDICQFQLLSCVKKEKKYNYKNQWAEQWSNKVDYYERLIKEKGGTKKILNKSFFYYIGLAENAISYVNNTTEDFKIGDNDLVSINHKRINYPNNSLNFYNPLSFIIDLSIRDIAEYFKILFFNKEDVWTEIDYYFSHTSLTDYSLRLFYARLLYPSYYFDLIEKVIKNEETEEKIIYYIDLIDDYESFLAEIYRYLNKKKPLPKIEWLVNYN